MKKKWYLLFLLFPVLFFILSLNSSLIEHHSFRQTQTALTTFWMLKKGAYLSYITPVMGFPWSIPMEFPIYQIITAFFSKISGNNLEHTGRSISFLFFLASYVVSYQILKPYKDRAILITFFIISTSPLLLFFSRAFLIESASTFFCLTSIFFYFNYERNKKLKTLLLFTLFGIIASLQKVTSFLPIILSIVIHQGSASITKEKLILNIKLLLSIFFILLIALLWISYSDLVKEQNYISSFLTSDALRSWNYGDLTQRVSFIFWLKVIWSLLVLGGLIALTLIPFFTSSRMIDFKLVNTEMKFMLANIFLPIVIFSNLFFNHDYYFYTTIFYASIFCGMYFSRLDYSKNSPRFKLFFAVIFFGINLLIFLDQYYFRIFNYPSYEKVVFNMSKDIKDRTDENEVILAVGMDWNSILPYYSERYSIMIPTWKGSGKYVPTVRGETIDIDKAFEKIETLLNGKEVGAIVQCNKYSWDIAHNIKLIKYISTLGPTKSYGNYCQVQYRK